MRREGKALARFMTNVVKTPSCWLWTGYKDDLGYGKYGGTGARFAHRIAYESFVGTLPDGLVPDHLCRNTSCVNPKHLEFVTPTENKRRGIGFAGENAAKRFCPNGHAYSGVNVRVGKSSSRICHTCAAEATRRWRRKRRFRESLAQIERKSATK